MSRVFTITDDTGDQVLLTYYAGTQEIILQADPLGVNLTPDSIQRLRRWLASVLVLAEFDRDADQEELFQSSLYESQNRPDPWPGLREGGLR